MRKSICILLILSLCFVLAACSLGAAGGVNGADVNPVLDFINEKRYGDEYTNQSYVDSSAGDWYEGQIGETMSTRWFDFVVESVELVDSYAGYTAEEGYKLLDVVITETNTFTDSLPMFDSDFRIDDPADTEYYVASLDPLDDTMMPLQFTLEIDETVTYHLVFEVAQQSNELTLFYTEEYTDSSGNDGIGDTYAIHITV